MAVAPTPSGPRVRRAPSTLGAGVTRSSPAWCEGGARSAGATQDFVRCLALGSFSSLAWRSRSFRGFRYPASVRQIAKAEGEGSASASVTVKDPRRSPVRRARRVVVASIAVACGLVALLYATSDLVDHGRFTRATRRPQVKSGLAKDFNEVIQVDFFQWRSGLFICIVDEATRYKVAGRLYFGPSKRIVCDQEGALMSQEAAPEFDRLGVECVPMGATSGAAGTKRTGTGMVERHVGLLKMTMAKCATEAARFSITPEPEELAAEAFMAHNLTLNIGGYSPSMMVFGVLPCGYLDVEEVPVRLRQIALQAAEASILEDRILRAGRTRPEKLDLSNLIVGSTQVDIDRDDGNYGWRGPALLLKINDADGTCAVEYQGRPYLMSLRHIRVYRGSFFSHCFDDDVEKICEQDLLSLQQLVEESNPYKLHTIGFLLKNASNASLEWTKVPAEMTDTENEYLAKALASLFSKKELHGIRYGRAVKQELQNKYIQLVVLRLSPASTIDKMIQVFRRQYQTGPEALKLQVVDAQENAKQLRCIVSSASVASYGSSVSKMSQAKAIHGRRLNLEMDKTPPKWDHAGQWQSVDAQLYTYFFEDLDEPLQNTRKPFRALVSPMPFDKGAMRFAFYVVDQENLDRKYVGKVYQFQDPVFQQKSTYEGDMASQAVASYLAKEFSLRYPERPIEFVPAQLLDLGDVSGFPFRFMAIEPWIPGKHEKYTSNAGHIAKDSDVAQAYSHYTWQTTDGDIMVVDIQGVGNTLTDPQIHSLDTNRFGRGNLSSKGMDAFFLNHVCNEICHTLKLEAHPLQPGSLHQEELAHHLGSIGEEVPSDEIVEGPELQVDWMPMSGSKLSAFLDAVRKDAEDLVGQAPIFSWMESESDKCPCLGGAVLRWNNCPEIVEVRKGSPAEKAGCQPGVALKLVGGTSVGKMSKKETLRLLAAENNMMVGMATQRRLKGMIDERREEESDGGLERLMHLMALKQLEDTFDGLLKGSDGLSRLLSKGSRLKALRELFEDSSETHDMSLKRHLFLEAVRADAAKRAHTPDAAESWDEQHAVASDTLGGAVFAWTSPPQVTAIVSASPADGVVSEGDALHEIDGENVETLPREEILRKLQDCGSIALKYVFAWAMPVTLMAGYVLRLRIWPYHAELAIEDTWLHKGSVLNSRWIKCFKRHHEANHVV
eukprot:g18946.t1